MLGVAHHVLSLAHSRGKIAGVHSHIAMRCPARQNSRFACRLEVPGFIGGIIPFCTPEMFDQASPPHLKPNQQHFPFRHWKLEHPCPCFVCSNIVQSVLMRARHFRRSITLDFTLASGMPSSRGDPQKPCNAYRGRPCPCASAWPCFHPSPTCMPLCRVIIYPLSPRPITPCGRIKPSCRTKDCAKASRSLASTAPALPVYSSRTINVQAHPHALYSSRSPARSCVMWLSEDTLHSALRCGHALAPQEGLHEGVQVPIEHSSRIASLHARSQVLHHLVRVQHVVAHLRRSG